MKLFFKSTLLSFLFIGAAQLSSAQMKKTASVEGITEYVLDNGMKVLLFPDNSSQTITVNVTYLVGSRHEGYGEKGWPTYWNTLFLKERLHTKIFLMN